MLYDSIRKSIRDLCLHQLFTHGKGLNEDFVASVICIQRTSRFEHRAKKIHQQSILQSVVRSKLGVMVTLNNRYHYQGAAVVTLMIHGKATFKARSIDAHADQGHSVVLKVVRYRCPLNTLSE